MRGKRERENYQKELRLSKGVSNSLGSTTTRKVLIYVECI